jgi:hypothetical protein
MNIYRLKNGNTVDIFWRSRGCTVIRLVLINAKFGICIVAGLNGTLVEAKIRT